MSRHRLLLTSAVAGLCAVACAAAPRQRPIKMGAVDVGPGSLEHARRQLEGTWALERAQVLDASGQLADVKAQGRLQLDAYGNLSVNGELQEPARDPTRPVPPEILQYAGRIVIDPDRQEFRLMDADLQTSVSAATQRRLDPTQVRRYRVEGDLLTISLIGPGGEPTATTVFRRLP